MHVFGHSWDEKKKAATIISFKFLKQQYDLITLTGPPIKSTQEIESKTSQRPYCSIVRSFTLKLLQYQTQKNEPFFVTELDFFRVSRLIENCPSYHYFIIRQQQLRKPLANLNRFFPISTISPALPPITSAPTAYGRRPAGRNTPSS